VPGLDIGSVGWAMKAKGRAGWDLRERRGCPYCAARSVSRVESCRGAREGSDLL